MNRKKPTTAQIMKYKKAKEEQKKELAKQGRKPASRSSNSKVQSEKEVSKKNKIIKPFGGNIVDNYLKKLHKSRKKK